MTTAIFIWIIVAVALAGMIGNPWGWFVAASIIVVSIGIHLLGFHPLTWILLNWQTALVYAAIYIAIGIAWSFIKFHSNARKIRASDIYAGYERSDPSEGAKIKFQELLSVVPFWIAAWPMSILWDMISDWLQSFFEWIAARLKGMYQRLFDYATGQEMATAVERYKLKKKEFEDENPFKE